MQKTEIRTSEIQRSNQTEMLIGLNHLDLSAEECYGWKWQDKTRAKTKSKDVRMMMRQLFGRRSSTAVALEEP